MFVIVAGDGRAPAGSSAHPKGHQMDCNDWAITLDVAEEATPGR